MIKILDKQYSSFAPVAPSKNAIAVFSLDCAKLVFEHTMCDFVIVLNEKTGKFGYCFNLHEVQQFLEKE